MIDEDYIKKFLKEGKNPKECYFNFDCLGCGHICCSSSFLPSITLHPYAIAFIRYKYGLDHLIDLFKKEILIKVYRKYSEIPVVKINTNLVYCPFLEIKIPQKKLESIIINYLKMDDPSEGEIYFYRYLTSLITNPKLKFIKKEKYLQFTLDNLFFEIMKNFIEDENQKKKSFLNIEKDTADLVIEINSILLKFIKNTFVNSKKCKSIRCGIYEARPGSCRSFPVGRTRFLKNVSEIKVYKITNQNLDKLNKVSFNYEDDEELEDRVIISRNVCPENAWNGKKRSIYAFFLEQEVNLYESNYWLIILAEFLLPNRNKIATMNKKELDDFHELIFEFNYLKPKFIENREKFYKNLKRIVKNNLIKEELKKRFGLI